MNEDRAEELNRDYLGIVARILTAIATKDCKTQKEKTALLFKAGLNQRQIANLLNTTVGTVKVDIQRLKKEEGATDAKKPGKRKR